VHELESNIVVLLSTWRPLCLFSLALGDDLWIVTFRRPWDSLRSHTAVLWRLIFITHCLLRLLLSHASFSSLSQYWSWCK